MAVAGHGDSVADHGFAGHDHDLPDKGFGEGFAFGHSLSFRNSVMSCARATMVSRSFLTDLRWERMNSASFNDASRRLRRSVWALIRISVSAGTSSVVSTMSQSRPSRRRTSAISDSMVSSLLRCSRTKLFQFFGNDLRQIADDGFSEDAGANPPDDQLLKAAGVEPGGIAAILAPL